MDEQQFWDIIEAVRTKADDPNHPAAELRAELEQLSPEQLIAFDQHYSRAFAASYRRDLWAMAYIIFGGCSDDAFMDFRNWLIMQGRAFYEAAHRDPELVAVSRAVGDDDVFDEETGYVVSHVYREKTGQELPASDEARNHPMEPSGEPWDEEDFPTRFPRAWEHWKSEWEE